MSSDMDASSAKDDESGTRGPDAERATSIDSSQFNAGQPDAGHAIYSFAGWRWADESDEDQSSESHGWDSDSEFSDAEESGFSGWANTQDAVHRVRDAIGKAYPYVFKQSRDSNSGGSVEAETRIQLLHPTPKTILPAEIRIRIYDYTLEGDHIWFRPLPPYRQTKISLFGLIDMDDILNELWVYKSDISSWYNKANAAFESRNEWYRCHELLSYEKASADMRERTHPDVVEDFQKYYWDTRVLDFTMILKVVDHRYYYKYLRLPASLTSPSHWVPTMQQYPEWNDCVKHLALDFDSTRVFNEDGIERAPDHDHPFYDELLAELQAKHPTSVVPSQYFTDMCNHIQEHVPNLETLYLWLKLSEHDIEAIFSAPPDKPNPLVELIRKIPVKSGGKFTVKLLVNIRTDQIVCENDALAADSVTGYLAKWNTDDGPVRYGKLCREFELKFESLMRPESLGPVEERSGPAWEMECALQSARDLAVEKEFRDGLDEHIQQEKDFWDNYDPSRFDRENGMSEEELALRYPDGEIDMEYVNVTESLIPV